MSRLLATFRDMWAYLVGQSVSSSKSGSDKKHELNASNVAKRHAFQPSINDLQADPWRQKAGGEPLSEMGRDEGNLMLAPALIGVRGARAIDKN
jgi:hypothetical protein